MLYGINNAGPISQDRLPLPAHADLVGDPEGCGVSWVDGRDEPFDPESSESEITTRERRLSSDTSTPAMLPRMPPHLDFFNLFDG